MSSTPSILLLEDPIRYLVLFLVANVMTPAPSYSHKFSMKPTQLLNSCSRLAFVLVQ